MMKLKFDPSLAYQLDAVSAVADAFKGQPVGQTTFEISATLPSGVAITEYGVGNRLILNDAQFLGNIRAIQERNGIERTEILQGREFSVEMETGTGKTYVYLRSIFELNKRYGFKKFIIVVPSIAIREGVIKSLEIMREHFQALYDNTPFVPFVYDSKRLGDVRQFAGGNAVQIMIINIQAFLKDVGEAETPIDSLDEEALKRLNVIYRDSDKMGGRPIEFIRSTCPIVIIDEPQSVDTTPKSRRAIMQLNPAATLRYSATHRNPYNLLYRLGPIEAYDRRLVKRIEVASIRADSDFSGAYVKLLKTDNKNGIKAQLEFHRISNGNPKPVKVWVKQTDDLFRLSNEHFPYHQGFVVQHIDATPGNETIEFNQGGFLELGQAIGGVEADVMKAMVRKTVEQHLKKERALRNQGIKVLSLFFLDKVASYRTYNGDGTTALGPVGKWLEEALTEFLAKPIYQGLVNFPMDQLHNGYFSQDKKGQAKDTRGNTTDDEDTYALIMRDKERLLDPKEPLRFIFSHTALREGWDNPNVFQICTLREVGTELERRQQIGRGLRLPVNENGERVHDEQLNRLTVIASESYKDFAAALQNEYERDFDIKFGRIERQAFAMLVRKTESSDEFAIGQDASVNIWSALLAMGYINSVGDIQPKFEPDNLLFRLQLPEEFEDLRAPIFDEMRRYVFADRIGNADAKREVRFNKQVHLREDFRELWGRISQKTRYRVAFETADLIDRAVNRLKAMERISPLTMTATRVDVDFTLAGIQADRLLENDTQLLQGPTVLPDIIAYLQKETELTRHTLVEILKASNRIVEFRGNPQQFMAVAAREIGYAMHDLMLEGIQYEKIAGEFWEMKRIEDDAEKGISRYLKNLYEVKDRSKALFDAIEFESEVERQFAQDLDSNENVKLFVKLPSWFKIETPIGSYNPDWAFVTERDERLYFVRETKGTLDSQDRRTKENQKILCGRRHFEVLGTNFDVVTNIAQVKF
ncbi:MAG: type restriction protein res subunit [Alphaproteobacteria bacterium]|nr:type restriction protein res subunit [Alphaproteobacteria bacterium]